jgi:hypothetical protein
MLQDPQVPDEATPRRVHDPVVHRRGFRRSRCLRRENAIAARGYLVECLL